MNCPQCRAEYLPEIARCPFCDVELVETPHCAKLPHRGLTDDLLDAPSGVAMVCPKCGIEMGPTYSRCPFCEVQLAGSSAAASQPSGLVAVADWSRDRLPFAIAESLLRSAGIPFISSGAHYGLGMLLVRAEDAEDARLLLAPPQDDVDGG